MPDTLSETKACEQLARIFRARGYRIVRNVTFREYGVSFHVDGWDPEARVGFEFLTSEDDDHDDLTLREYQTLMAAQQRGELALFVIDEVEPLSAADLAESAEAFLDEVAAARKPAARRKHATKQVATKSAAGARAAAKKPTAKKTAAKKPAARKPAAKKAASRRKRAPAKR